MCEASSSTVLHTAGLSSSGADFLGSTFEHASSSVEALRPERQPVRAEACVEDERSAKDALPGGQVCPDCPSKVPVSIF